MNPPAIVLIVFGAAGFFWAVTVPSLWGMIAGFIAVGFGLLIDDEGG